MTDTITIRNGSFSATIPLDSVHEYPAANWKSLMRQLARGGKANAEAVEVLDQWFPAEVRDAHDWWRDACRTYEREFRSYKQTPRAEWEAQKTINAALSKTRHDAYVRWSRLYYNNQHYLAATASMKKEK